MRPFDVTSIIRQTQKTLGSACVESPAHRKLHQQIDLCLRWRNTWDIQSRQNTAQEHCSVCQIYVTSGQMSKPFKFQINPPAGRTVFEEALPIFCLCCLQSLQTFSAHLTRQFCQLLAALLFFLFLCPAVPHYLTLWWTRLLIKLVSLPVVEGL